MYRSSLCMRQLGSTVQRGQCPCGVIEDREPFHPWNWTPSSKSDQILSKAPHSNSAVQISIQPWYRQGSHFTLLILEKAAIPFRWFARIQTNFLLKHVRVPTLPTFDHVPSFCSERKLLWKETCRKLIVVPFVLQVSPTIETGGTTAHGP